MRRAFVFAATFFALLGSPGCSTDKLSSRTMDATLAILNVTAVTMTDQESQDIHVFR
jgi:hypothetical protein